MSPLCACATLVETVTVSHGPSVEGPARSPNTGAGPTPPLSPFVAVVCVAGMLRTEVVDAALLSGLDVRLILHGQLPPHSYSDVLRELWRETAEWVVCEQDTVPPPGALGDMVDCPADWCTLPHWVGTHWETRSLGVARFGRQLRERFPDLADQALGPRRLVDPPRHWKVCDTEIARVLDILGVQPHVHDGRTEHLHDYGV